MQRTSADGTPTVCKKGFTNVAPDALRRPTAGREPRFEAGALPQPPNAGQSRTIDRRSGHGVKPHLQIDLCDLPIPCL